jgi:hypothetical protein
LPGRQWTHQHRSEAQLRRWRDGIHRCDGNAGNAPATTLRAPHPQPLQPRRDPSPAPLHEIAPSKAHLPLLHLDALPVWWTAPIFSALRMARSEGRTRAKAGGVRFGRPLKLTLHQRREARQRHDAGETLVDIGRSFNVSHMTVARAVALEASRP